ncbi:MAG TPA: choice-of-anchor Q domain-containing protein [Solirubrobacterales bacterium]
MRAGAHRLRLAVPIISLLVIATPAQAATLVVTKASDSADGACDADCSLREAIIAANADATADEIVLPAAVLRLERSPFPDDNSGDVGDLDVTGDLTIRGQGANATTVNSTIEARVFDVLGPNTDLRLRDLTVTGGHARFPDDSGGGINAEKSGELSLERVIVRDNVAQGAASVGPGGGIYKSGGRLVVRDSAIVGNRGVAAGFGGGIFAESTSAELTNVTVAENLAGHRGGGVYLSAAAGDFVNVTIVSNEARGFGGGLDGDLSLLRLRSSIVAANAAPTEPECTSPGPASDGGNVGPAACGLTQPSDASPADPGLGPLSTSGIPVREPLPGSPAVDRAIGPCPLTDARGVPRPQGPACDSGAGELPVPPLAPPTDTTAPVGSKLAFVPRRFRPRVKRAPSIASASARKRGKRSRRTSRASYRLSEDARVRFTVRRRVTGRKKGKRCLIGKRSRRLGKARKCRRFVRVRGAFTHRGKQGANRFRFSGYVRGRRLRPGVYRMSGVPTDAAGNRGRRFSGSFVIARR